jgi:hypothetical protein
MFTRQGSPVDQREAAPVDAQPDPREKANGVGTTAEGSTSSAGKSTLPGVDAAAQPLAEGWLRVMRKERTLPARSKVCMRCDADVALDTFRKPVGDGWLCSECVSEEDARSWDRRKLVVRAVATVAVIAVASGLTAGAIQVAPFLLAPHGQRPK